MRIAIVDDARQDSAALSTMLAESVSPAAFLGDFAAEPAPAREARKEKPIRVDRLLPINKLPDVSGKGRKYDVETNQAVAVPGTEPVHAGKLCAGRGHYPDGRYVYYHRFVYVRGGTHNDHDGAIHRGAGNCHRRL